jgi:hypothetical protein
VVDPVVDPEVFEVVIVDPELWEPLPGDFELLLPPQPATTAPTSASRTASAATE